MTRKFTQFSAPGVVLTEPQEPAATLLLAELLADECGLALELLELDAELIDTLELALELTLALELEFALLLDWPEAELELAPWLLEALLTELTAELIEDDAASPPPPLQPATNITLITQMPGATRINRRSCFT